MSLRPELHDRESLSRGYRTRLGYGDAMEGLPMFSADRSYVAGYERGRTDAVSDKRCGTPRGISEAQA